MLCAPGRRAGRSDEATRWPTMKLLLGRALALGAAYLAIAHLLLNFGMVHDQAEDALDRVAAAIASCGCS